MVEYDRVLEEIIALGSARQEYIVIMHPLVFARLQGDVWCDERGHIGAMCGLPLYVSAMMPTNTWRLLPRRDFDCSRWGAREDVPW